MVKYYEETYPNSRVVSRTTAEIGDDLNFVNNLGKIASYAVVDGRRITASRSSMKAPNSIIQMEFDGDVFVGQVTDIFSHRQKGLDAGRDESVHLFRIQWFRPYESINTDIWDQ